MYRALYIRYTYAMMVSEVCIYTRCIVMYSYTPIHAYTSNMMYHPPSVKALSSEAEHFSVLSLPGPPGYHAD